MALKNLFNRFVGGSKPSTQPQQSHYSPPLGENIFEKAKSLSLSSFLVQNLPGILNTSKTAGRYQRFNTCPHCGPSSATSTKLNVTDDRVYHCFSCGQKGSIIDAAVAIWGCTPKEAAQRLTGQTSRRPASVPQAAPVAQTNPEEEEKLHRVQMDTFARIGITAMIQAHRQKPDKEILDYLVNVRGFTMPVIREAWNRQLLGFLPNDPRKATDLLVKEIGREALEEAQLWKKDKRMPGIAFRPIVFFLPGLQSAEFRLARPAKEGERKSIRYGPGNIPYFWRGEEDSKTAIAEGIMDLLALVCLGWKGHILAYPGVASWHIDHLVKFQEKHGPQHFHIMFDADEAGRLNAQRLHQAACTKGIKSTIFTLPHEGMDINDYLLMKKKESVAKS